MLENVRTNFQQNSSKTLGVCNTKLLVFCTEMDKMMDRKADSSIPPKYSFCGGIKIGCIDRQQTSYILRRNYFGEHENV